MKIQKYILKRKKEKTMEMIACMPLDMISCDIVCSPLFGCNPNDIKAIVEETIPSEDKLEVVRRSASEVLVERSIEVAKAADKPKRVKKEVIPAHLLLQQAMKDGGISATVLAEVLDTSPPVVYNWLSGKTCPQMKFARKIARLVKIPAKLWEQTRLEPRKKTGPKLALGSAVPLTKKDKIELIQDKFRNARRFD